MQQKRKEKKVAILNTIYVIAKSKWLEKKNVAISNTIYLVTKSKLLAKENHFFSTAIKCSMLPRILEPA
jgi:hypothetical protein